MADDSALEAMTPAPRLDNQDAALFGQTPSQTVGPFFHYGLPWKGGADLVGQSDLGARPDLVPEAHFVLKSSGARGKPAGQEILIAGNVLDARGEAIPDAMVEIWQANAAGRYCSPDDPREDVARDPNFIGFGRTATDLHGIYRFRTILPGRVPGPGNSLQAPHIAVSIFARGVLKRLSTRLYFANGEGNDTDPILSLVPQERRHTLIAELRVGGWWLDLVLGGPNETVFFDL